MRILHVIHSVDPRSGGPSHALRGLLRQQIDRGHQVSVVSTETQSAEPWAPPCDYRQSITTDPAFDGAEVFLGRALGRYRPLSRFAYSRSCRRWLSDRLSDPGRRPQIVHIHGVFSHVTSAAARLARRHRVPYIIRPAGALSTVCLARGSHRLKKLFVRVLLNQDLRAAAWIHTTCQAEADDNQTLIGHDRLVVLPLGVDLPAIDTADARSRLEDRWPTFKGCRIILFFGRLHQVKRPGLALEAFRRLRSECSNLRLLFAGSDAGCLADLHDVVRTHGLDDEVVFSGFLQGELKSAALTAADVAVLPSIHENFSMAVAEALAHATPVVVTPGVGAHIHVDAAGAGVTVGDTVEAIVAGLRHVLDNDPQSMGRRGRAYVREYLTWQIIADQIELMYRRAIDSNSSGCAQYDRKEVPDPVPSKLPTARGDGADQANLDSAQINQ